MFQRAQCSSPDHLPPTESRVANAGLDNISFFQVEHLLLVSKQCRLSNIIGLVDLDHMCPGVLELTWPCKGCSPPQPP